MPRLLQTAIQHAVGRSGVSVVSLPGDIAAEPAPDKALESALVTSRPTVRPGDAEIDRLVEMIDKAGRVTLFCGSGTAGAHTEVMQFAQRIKSPVGHALRGKEWIQYDNPYTGHLRMYTTPHADTRVGRSTAVPGQGQFDLV